MDANDKMTIRLTIVDGGRFGIYQVGVGRYLMHPTQTMLFPDEVKRVYKHMIKQGHKEG
jgi:hypothetical protein